jgi:hypothetical protein
MTLRMCVSSIVRRPSLNEILTHAALPLTVLTNESSCNIVNTLVGSILSIIVSCLVTIPHVLTFVLHAEYRPPSLMTR